MRYVPISQLKDGMVLAHNFYGSNFEVLLVEGMTLSASRIRRINELGYAGVYINDSLSADIDVADIIPVEMRLKTIKAAREILLQAESGQFETTGAKVTKDDQQRIILPIIEAIIDSKKRMIDMIDLKPYEYYSYYHAANVVVLSLLIGVEMGISGTQLHGLGMAALLHDVGNIFVPKAILNKPGKLTPEEYDVVKQHTEMGFQFLKKHFDISIDACMGVFQHHENFDGTGYPTQLKKNKISIEGRIIAICNVYDAMTSRRPYRQPMLPADAIKHMNEKSGTMFDPDILDILYKVIAQYPSSLCVELNTNVRCIVVDNYPGDPQRPCLRLLNNRSSTPLIVDLHSNPAFKDTHISKIIDI